ncbi:lipoprotein [Flavobacterium sp. HSC-32F16]
MKKIFFLIIITAFLSSCQEKKVTFVNLEKHSGEGFF